MKRYGIIILIILAGTFRLQASDSTSAAREARCDVSEIKADISFLNLFNGLYLTEKQMQDLLVCLKKVEAIEKEADERYTQVYWEVQDHYSRLRKTLMENSGLSQEMEMLSYKLDGKLHDIDVQTKAKIYDIEQDVKQNILSQNQLDIISDFVDCLIPPQNLKSPVRVGQVPDIGECERVLDRVRAADEKAYPAMAKQEVDAVLEHIDEHHEVLNQDQKSREAKRLTDAFARARGLNDEDYEIQKYDIALTMDHDTQFHKWWVKNVKGQPGEVAGYLLKARNIPLLEQRLARMQHDREKISATAVKE